MFVDWITGDFGVVTRHTSVFKEYMSNVFEYAESRSGGYLLQFDRGLMMEPTPGVDSRKIKN